MSLTSILPAPSQYTWDQEAEDRERQKSNSAAVAIIAASTAPPYGQRKGWVPRTPQDFGDGGAFPEIQVAQYPLSMGYKGESSTSNALAVQLDAQGKVKYDVLARQGQSKYKIVYSKYTDLLPSEVTRDDDPDLQRPTQETIEEETEKTRKALEKLTQGKIAAAMPVRAAERTGPAQFIRYTPSQQGVAFNSGAKQRVIRMVDVQTDPMEPPKFRINKKIPRGPPSPPAPVMHSPTRKVTVKEQMEWKIPPCISNWKNAKGYTIPLDKRLSADGRGLQQVHINENFAKLAESLYIADRKARDAVEMRAQLEKKLARNEKEKKEENLRALAQKARNERAGIHASVQEQEVDVQERRNLLHERHKERDRERNIARAAPDRRSKLERGRARDITEQIALGMPDPRAGGNQETQFDQRLFNQSKGMDSGFGDDEGYNVYDKPWRETGNISQSIYRPSKNLDQDLYGDDYEKIMTTNRFTQGKERPEGSGTGSRSGPVQFRKPQKEDDSFDPFNLIPFLDEAKRASKRQSDQTSSDYKRRRRE